MRYVQEFIRYFNFIGFGALAAYAYTCPCEFIYACHMNQFIGWTVSLIALNAVNIAYHLFPYGFE